jgi:hypothetical protein
MTKIEWITPNYSSRYNVKKNRSQKSSCGKKENKKSPVQRKEDNSFAQKQQKTLHYWQICSVF